MRPITDAERAQAQRECTHETTMLVNHYAADRGIVIEPGQMWEMYCGACWLTSARRQTREEAEAAFAEFDRKAKAE